MGFKNLKNKKWFAILTNTYVLVLTVFAIWMLFFDTNSLLIHRELEKEIRNLQKTQRFLRNEIEKDKKVLAPDGVTYFNTPKLVAKTQIVGTIATPIIVEDKIVVATDSGLFLYKLVKTKNNEHELVLLDKVPDLEIDATPIVWDNKVYIAVRNGYMYCFGDN